MSSVADKERWKRDVSAFAVALLIHLFIAAAFIISHFLFFQNVEEYRGPVLVKLGRTDAPDEETDQQPVIPESTDEKETQVEENISETAEEIKSGEPQEPVKTDESESESALDRPVSEEENGDRGDSDSSSEETSENSSASDEESSLETTEDLVTITKGSEEGNAYETTYEATPGIVGRNLWIPIYMYMPLPQFVDKSIFEAIKSDDELEHRPGKRSAESKQDHFLRFYELLGEEFYLKNRPDPDERPQIWSILEDGSYNLEFAEYKDGKSLNPVVITFTVNTGDDGNTIDDITVSRSSGYGDIDDAVVYGFLKASFYNSSDIPVKGRFTYRFD